MRFDPGLFGVMCPSWLNSAEKIVDMTLNGSGVRDIVRVLGVSSATVIKVLKKKRQALSK